MDVRVARAWSALSRNGKRAAMLLALNVVLFVAVCVAVGAACRRAATNAPVVASTAPSGTAPASASADSDAEAPSEPLDPREAELWAIAVDGGDEELARLAAREGSVGLVERGADPARRMTAIRALAYVHDFVALPWLAELATGTNDAEALAALESVGDIAAQPRRAVDPEDGAELRAGCDRIVALAKDTKANKDRRIVAIRAIRMMLDRGCAKPDEIPTDLDAK